MVVQGQENNMGMCIVSRIQPCFSATPSYNCRVDHLDLHSEISVSNDDGSDDAFVSYFVFWTRMVLIVFMMGEMKCIRALLSSE